MQHPRLWVMAAYGFAAGLPLPLSGFTFRLWLSEGGVSLAAIGLTANIGLAYTLKFLWAPVLDQTRRSAGITVGAGHTLVAPTLIRSQVLSQLHEAVGRGDLPAETALTRLRAAWAVPIRLLGDAVRRSENQGNYRECRAAHFPTPGLRICNRA